MEELRWRLLWCLAAILILAVPGYFLVDKLLAYLARITGPLIFIRPTEAFFVRMEGAFLLGAFFSVPFLIYQGWRYVGLALTGEERGMVLKILPFSYLLFAGGVCLAWFVVVPVGLRFLVSFGSGAMRPALSAQSSLEFALWVTLGMGIFFQIPIVSAVLAKAGLIQAKTLRFYRRHALLAILILAALLTPGPDLASQLLLALPAYLLYEVSIVIVGSLGPSADKQTPNLSDT